MAAIDASFDTETYILFPIFALGTGATLGLVEADFLPVIDLGTVYLEFANVEWTLGRLLAAATLIGVMVNRDASLMDTRGIDLWVAYATLGMILAPPFFPAFEATLAEDPAALIAWLTQSVGFAVVTYVN